MSNRQYRMFIFIGVCAFIALFFLIVHHSDPKDWVDKSQTREEFTDSVYDTQKEALEKLNANLDTIRWNNDSLELSQKRVEVLMHEVKQLQKVLLDSI